MTEPSQRTVVAAPNHLTTVGSPAPQKDFQEGVDAFFRSMVPAYRTPSGPVVVATTFFMVGGADDRELKVREDKDRKAFLVKLAVGAGLDGGAVDRIQQGRGTPREIHTLTQALIDAQPDRPLLDGTTTWQPLDIRMLMHENAIGIDCAGYVQQAYLSATGRTRGQLGFGTIVNENLSGLAGRGFVGIMDLASARPGDIISFAPPVAERGERVDPVGHRAIVFDQRLANAADRSLLAEAKLGPAFIQGGPIRVLEMDSSYGDSGKYDEGGVQRQTWIFNESTKQWAVLYVLDMSVAEKEQDKDKGSDADKDQKKLPSLQWVVGNRTSLYGHPLEGYFRRRGD